MNLKSMLKTPLIIFAVLALSACEKQQRAKPQVEVVVKQAEEIPYQSSTSFVGTLRASSDVSIEARVKAKIIKVNFKQGRQVQAGDILIELDDKELQAQKNQVKAEVSRARSALKVANKDFARGKELAPDGYISSSELDDLEGTLAESESALEQALAKLENAEVNLSYSKIIAPLSGKIDRSIYTVGDIVSPESGTITTIVAVNTMEVSFQLSESIYWKIVRKYQKENMNERRKVIVEIAFDKNDIYDHLGTIDFISNRVNPETGSMEVRAIIPNPDAILKPGQFVTVNIKSPEPIPTLMVPQTAVQSDQQGNFVLMILEDNTVKRMNVDLGKRVDLNVIVNSGIKLGDTVIVRGVQKVREGQKVKTISFDSKTAPTPPVSSSTSQP